MSSLDSMLLQVMAEYCVEFPVLDGGPLLSALITVVCIYQVQSPSLPLPLYVSGKHKFLFSICDSISVL